MRYTEFENQVVILKPGKPTVFYYNRESSAISFFVDPFC